MNISHQPFSYRSDPAVPDFPDDHPVIIFDEYCVLCSRWTQFVIRYDKDKQFKLLAAQSPLGHALYQHYGLDPINYETNILIEDGVAWFKSEGSIRMLERLGRPWSFAGVFRMLPLRIRDRAYASLAQNRFRLFGRRNSCFMPTAEIQERFLE